MPAGRLRYPSATRSASLLTCAGASVGVSISTQPRMPSRMDFESKEAAIIFVPLSGDHGHCHAPARSGASMVHWHLKPASHFGGQLARGDMLDQIDNAAAEFCIGDARKGASQRQSFRGREKVRDVCRRRAFAKPIDARDAARTALEQKRDRDLEDLGDLLDAAGADPVGAFLVFLNLLEGETQGFAELFLAHAEHDAAHAHATADIFVNRVGRFDRHLQTLLKAWG